ncbi:hypothetical protein ACFL3D_02100 [Candidatus Omnitrophota bacterium]
MIAHEKLSFLNIILGCAVIAIGAMLIVNVMTFSQRYNLDSSEGFLINLPTLSSASVQEETQDVHKLKTMVLTKKLFRPLIKPQVKQKNILTIDTLTKDLLLIGVVKQDQPEAIIKNRRTRQTYFVKQGSSLGQLTVDSIEDEKVILQYQSSKKELFIQ